MILAMVGYCICSVIFVIACEWGRTLTPFTENLLILGMLVASALNCFIAASNAMAVDGTEPESPERSQSLVRKEIARSFGTIVSYVGGFLILTAALTDYTYVW